MACWINLNFRVVFNLWTSFSPKSIYDDQWEKSDVNSCSGRIEKTIIVSRFEFQHKSVENAFRVKVKDSVHRVLFYYIKLINHPTIRRWLTFTISQTCLTRGKQALSHLADTKMCTSHILSKIFACFLHHFLFIHSKSGFPDFAFIFGYLLFGASIKNFVDSFPKWLKKRLKSVLSYATNSLFDVFVSDQNRLF